MAYSTAPAAPARPLSWGRYSPALTYADAVAHALDAQETARDAAAEARQWSSLPVYGED